MVTNQFGTECPHFVIKTANDVILTKVTGSIICTECKNPETPQTLWERNFGQNGEK